MKLFASVLSLFLLPTLLMAGPDAAMQARVAAALASATLTKPATPSTVKTAVCYCDEGCTCPCGPDCPCPVTGCFVKTDHGVYKVSGSNSTLCPCGTNCICTNGECGSPNCPLLRRDAITLGCSLASLQKKDLVVHVGGDQQWAHTQYPEALHIHVKGVDVKDGPGVIHASCTQSPCKWMWYNSAPATSTFAPIQQTYQPTFIPMMQPMMPMMGGGFSGFCGGGGCSS